MRVPFRERNPTPIGLTAFAVIIVSLLIAMNLENLPLVGGNREYTAAFAEAAGLRDGEEVRIAGVKVGKVTGMELAGGGYVRVKFQVNDDVRLGDLTRAEIKIKTLLGSHYLAVDPRGRGDLDKQIPLARTATPFEVVPALGELSSRVDQIDTAQVAKSLDTLSDTFANSPEEIKASLKGLRRLSETISERDSDLHELTNRAKNVSELLADRNADFTRLVHDGDKILQAVRARRAVIHQLLVNTVVMSQQVNALIAENEAELRPMLKNLQRVNTILLKNQQNLDRIIELYAPLTRQFTDATGTGRWFDSYIQNLIPIPAGIEDPPGHEAAGNGQNGGPGQPGGQPRNQQPGDDNPLPFLP